MDWLRKRVRNTDDSMTSETVTDTIEASSMQRLDMAEREPREHTMPRGRSAGERHGVRSNATPTLSVISLFAGIGGFDLGFTQAGMEVVAHVEKDANCRKLLAAKFPDAAVLDDVCTAGFGNLPDCDVLAGGWPCQDLSQAGKRAGLAGARSGLFYEYARIAYELQPTFLVWENVPGLLTSDDGRDMLRVVMELQRIGYCGGWRTLDAQFLGVAQRRRRVFGVFTRVDSGAARCAEILSLEEGVRGHPAPRREAREDIAGTIGGSSQSGGFRTTDLDNSGAFVCGTLTQGAHPGSYNGQDAYTGHLVPCCSPVAHTLRGEGADASEDGTGRGSPLVAYRTAGNCGPFEQGDKTACLNTATDPSQNIVANASDVRRLTPLEWERLQGFPDGWTEGFSDSTRYKMLGNAIAVPVARWIGSRIRGNVAGARGGSAGSARADLAEFTADPSHINRISDNA